MKTLTQLHNEMTAILAEINAMPPAEAIESEAWKTAEALHREINHAVEIEFSRIHDALRHHHNNNPPIQ